MRDVEATMPAIAPIEDLRAAQEELLAAKDLDELKRVFKRWRLTLVVRKTSASSGQKKRPTGD